MRQRAASDRFQILLQAEVEMIGAEAEAVDEITASTSLITTLINTSSLVRHLPDQKEDTSVVRPERRGIECCASGYPDLKSFQ